MGYVPLADRAAVLHAHPLYFIQAAKLLESIVSGLTAYPQNGRVMLFGHVPLSIADALSEWGADLAEIETDADLEDCGDREPEGCET